MSKTRKKIYFAFFTLLLIYLIAITLNFIFFKKNKTNSTEIVPINSTPTDIIPPPTTEITWEETINLLQECKIMAVFQKRNLEVILTDKNEQIYKTKEPKFNDIIYQTNHLRSDCNDVINAITE